MFDLRIGIYVLRMYIVTIQYVVIRSIKLEQLTNRGNQ